MSDSVFLFVEGDGDEIFIRDYIQHLGLNQNSEIILTDGYTKLHLVKNKFLENSEGMNLLIFDSDTPETNGGFQVRKARLESKKIELGIDFELFLFPNNKEDGEFENLLEKIINSENQFILDCFDDYMKCLEKSKRQLNLPNLKAKIYSYISVLPKSRKQNEKFKKKEDLFYKNTDFFKLDHSYLNSLKAFLEKYLS